jgi:hypothetical protein
VERGVEYPSASDGGGDIRRARRLPSVRAVGGCMYVLLWKDNCRSGQLRNFGCLEPRQREGMKISSVMPHPAALATFVSALCFGGA